MSHNKLRILYAGIVGMGLAISMVNTTAQSENPNAQPKIAGTTVSPSLRFVAIGDMPYNKTEERLLNRVINPALDKAGFPFILHLGDYKTQRLECVPENDAFFEKWLSERSTPVFYTPGDNEWADCDYQALATPMSELQRLEKIRSDYFPNKVDAPQLSVEQQDRQRENQSWVVRHDNSSIVFGSLHVIGSKNGRDGIHQDKPTDVIRQIEMRNHANKQWIESIFRRAAKENASAVVIAQHGDPSNGTGANKPCTADHNDLNCDPYFNLKNQLAEKAQLFGNPVLLIHGDTSPICLETGFHNTPNLWRFNSTGDGVLTDAVVIEISPAAVTPFKINTLIWGLMPGACKN